MNTSDEKNQNDMNQRDQRSMNEDDRKRQPESAERDRLARTDHVPDPDRMRRTNQVFDATDDAEMDAEAMDRETADYEPGDSHVSYLDDQAALRAGSRWQEIQAEFVDDPRKTVAQAHELVGELVQTIVDRFTRERAELERQWSRGTEVSTEDLRVCLQRYRAFFNQLLPQALSGQRSTETGQPAKVESQDMHR